MLPANSVNEPRTKLIAAYRAGLKDFKMPRFCLHAPDKLALLCEGICLLIRESFDGGIKCYSLRMRRQAIRRWTELVYSHLLYRVFPYRIAFCFVPILET